MMLYRLVLVSDELDLDHVDVVGGTHTHNPLTYAMELQKLTKSLERLVLFYFEKFLFTNFVLLQN